MAGGVARRAWNQGCVRVLHRASTLVCLLLFHGKREDQGHGHTCACSTKRCHTCPAQSSGHARSAAPRGPALATSCHERPAAAAADNAAGPAALAPAAAAVATVAARSVAAATCAAAGQARQNLRRGRSAQNSACSGR
eukprot:353394-Chlamydomonas_euryale.AAC.3